MFGQARNHEGARRRARAPRPRGAHWVKPKLVAEIAFAEFTADNVVRHASFLGLRGDKTAKEVVAGNAPEGARDRATDDVKISNPDRVIFPDAKVTKGELADLLPRGRRARCCPGPRTARSAWSAARRAARRNASSRSMTAAVSVRTSTTSRSAEKDGGKEDYLYVEDVGGPLACVQMGTIEFHGWGAKVADVEKPDRIVFDLDPDEGLDFDDGEEGRERSPPPSRRHGPADLPDADRRQGRPCRRRR